MKKKLVIGLSLSVLLIGGVIFLNKTHVNADDNMKAYTSKENASIMQSMNEKELIQYKMLNSIDFFDNSEGSFEYFSKSQNNLQLIEYSVDIKNNKSYTKTKSIKNENNIDTSIEVAYINGKQKTFYNKDKTYLELGTSSTDKDDKSIKNLKPKDRYIKNDDGSKKYITRVDSSYMGIASSVLFNENIALGFLEDYSKWDIIGEEIYLNINCTKVVGTLNDYYSEKLGGKNFTMLIDKNTGILLMLEILNDNKEVGYSITSKEITINKGINEEKVKKSTEGYKSLD